MPDLNPPADPQDEFLELVVRSLDTELTPDETRKLNEQLRQDPRCRERYVQICLQAQLIRKACAAESAATREDHARPSPRTTRRKRVSGDGGTQSWQPALMAAVVLFGLVGLLVLLSSPTDERPPAKAVRWTPMPVEERAHAEARLQEIERKQSELAKPPAQPELARDAEEKRQKELEELQREKARIEQELRDSVRVVRQAAPEPEKRPTPPAPPKEDKAEPRTQAAIAVIEESVGDVFFVTKDGKTPAVAGNPVVAGQSILTGAGKAAIVYPDKTRVELGADTRIEDLKSEGGKGLFVAFGRILAMVSKQPKEQPMLCGSPYGEAKVVGTTLRLIVDRDASSTRLEVEEGKVQLKNLAGKTVDVPSGHFAVAAAGTEMAARPLPIHDILILATSQAKKSGEEWRLVKDDKAASGSAWEAVTVFPRSTAKDLMAQYGAAQARILNRIAAFVEFRFTADAGRDYVVWTRGSCLALDNPAYDQPLYFYDDLILEFPTGQLSRSIPAGPNFCLMNGFTVRKGYWWLSGDAWTDQNVAPPPKPQDAVPIVVRFSKAGPQVLRLYAPSSVLRIDAIWLSATQKTRPDDKSTGPVR
jgi:ferric-dicitrate binding protein FerR (iron transport regulator)